jgi:DNA-binding MarR family transcriptional regulator
MAISQKAPAPVGGENFELLIRLLKLGTLINGPMKDGVCDPCGVSQVELKVMLALAGEGALAGHDLAEIMGVPAMNVSRALASLRERGLIENALDPENRRRKPVRLSAAGLAEYRRVSPDMLSVADAILSGLSPKERKSFAAISDGLIARMTEWIISHHAGVKFHG